MPKDDDARRSHGFLYGGTARPWVAIAVTLGLIGAAVMLARYVFH